MLSRDVAIKAVVVLRNKIASVRLRMLGEGEYLPELRKRVSQLD